MSDAISNVITNSIGDVHYIFRSNGQYQLIQNKVLSEEGTFKVDQKNSVLELATIKSNKTVVEEYSFILKNTRLVITEKTEDEPLTVILEKQN